MERAVAMMAANKIVLILIMIEETHSPLHQIATLGCQTVSSARLPDGRMGYGMSNHSVQLLDLTRNTVETLKTNHTKRLNKFDVHGDTLATSSNDGSVRLYDLRTFKQTLMLKKNQEEFYSVALGDDIVGGGGVGNITFWDLRNKKEVGNFSDSFNEEVTHLYLDSKTLYGCSLDGLVGCFDITKSEEDGTEWTYRFSNPVDGLRLQNGHVLTHTADHHLGLIRDGELIKKYSPNSPQTPKHLFWSQFNGKNVSYYVWNINNEKIEKWVDNELALEAKNNPDVDFLEEVTDNRAVIVDGFGNVYMVDMKQPELEPQSHPEATADLYIEENDIVEGGIIKPSYKKRTKKDYRPF